MREIHNGYIIPDYIVRPVEIPTLGSKPEVVLIFRKDFDYKNREFTQYCMTERDIVSPALREFFESTTFVMNVWEDPEHPRRWLGKRFTPEQYMNMVKRCEDLEYRARFYRELKMNVPNSGVRYVAQYGKAKWPTGGGRNASAAGKFFYADRDVTGELFRKYLHVDPNKMNPRERVSRTAILFGNPKRFEVPPRIVLADYETGGTAIVSSEFADREGISHGDKLWPIKASAVVSKLSIEGADMVIPKDAIKFEEHNDTAVVAPLMSSIPELSAKARSSVEKERLPKLAFDTMQWMFPELNSLLDTDMRLRDSLALVRRVVEGAATPEEIASLAEYTDGTGKPQYPREFHYILNGHPKEDAHLRRAILKVAGTAALKALCFKVRGEYGVAMPLTTEATELTMIMPPWMLPFRVNGSTKVENVVSVSSEWAIDCLGKDYDGDLAMSLELSGLLRRVGLPQDTFFSWNNEEDREFVKRFMTLPEKKKEAVNRDSNQVMADGLKSYGLIGQATNMSMVVIDAMRATGMYNRRQLMGIYLRMMSVEVQPFVDALKYDPNELKAPVLESKYTRSGRLLQVGLAEKYGIDPRREFIEGDKLFPNPEFGKPLPNIERIAARVQAYFRAVRSMDFEKLAELPEDPELNGSFYYRLSRLFAGWKPYQSVDLEERARELVREHPIPPELEAKRARSFPMFKGLKDVYGNAATPEAIAEKRWEFLEDSVTTPELAIGLVASCWVPNRKGTRDTRFALFLAKRLGVDFVKGTCNTPAKEEQAPVAEEAPQGVLS